MISADPRAEVEAHPLGDVALVEHLGDLGGHAAGQEAWQRLDHGDLGAELARRGGELEADEPAADHREVPAGPERRADAGRVVQRAQRGDGRPVGPGQRQGPRPGAGREEQALVRDRFAIEEHMAGGPVDPERVARGAEIDAGLGQPLRAADRLRRGASAVIASLESGGRS